MTKGSLLVVDDELEIREMLARHFRFLDYEVDLAANGAEALLMLLQRRFDVVISDIKMPVMNGIKLLETIRREYPMMHVIIVTGFVTQENLLACMREKADTCVFKPLEDLRELEDAVDKAMANINGWKRKIRELRGMKPSLDETGHG